MELVNTPVPDPSSVQFPPTTGFGDVSQQTPYAVTGAPPSEVTSPPAVAVVEVILDGCVVVTVGSVEVVVVKVRSLP
jgi:hypothetical protein